MKRKNLCKTNKEALRWCVSRKATIEFDDWRSRIGGHNGIAKGITCAIHTEPYKPGYALPWHHIDKTVIKAVNKIIAYQQKNEFVAEI